MIASILAFAVAAQAQTGAQPQTPPIIVEGEKPAEDKKVCRNVRETGSHRVKQVCRSAIEQRQADIQARNIIKMGNRSPNAPEAFVPPPPE
jgi:hypothetical protein